MSRSSGRFRVAPERKMSSRTIVRAATTRSGRPAAAPRSLSLIAQHSSSGGSALPCSCCFAASFRSASSPTPLASSTTGKKFMGRGGGEAATEPPKNRSFGNQNKVALIRCKFKAITSRCEPSSLLHVDSTMIVMLIGFAQCSSSLIPFAKLISKQSE